MTKSRALELRFKKVRITECYIPQFVGKIIKITDVVNDSLFFEGDHLGLVFSDTEVEEVKE